ncbi:YafY family protein [Actinotalea sp. K2]|uniref:helix-turn-helix transcriptional regulator n=1 Tax=Actinotalea sp. K2 TaxID=2939438 RepID=UPI002017B723|nr:WYL domain-containing protein [Actinotalea sp. K2]MCL3862804.1 WYL domain-containing protein [Actinotalea sp. K2]
MPAQIPPAERLLNLVIALVNTTGRMTKEQIRTSVAGYDPSGSTEAFERMFERDKDTLRELGVPVLTVTDQTHGDDQGYRIDPDAYALPPMELTSAQLGVLALAAEFWHDQSLQADAARALTKLRAVGATPTATDAVAALAPRVHPAGPALVPLLDAAQDRRVVSFTYRAASTGEVRRRTVEPWRLIASRGGWYLVGRDRDRAAPRVFRLSRITGSVTTSGGPDAFTVPPDADPNALLLSSQTTQGRVARLAVATDRAGALRARATSVVGESTPDARTDVPAGMDVLEVSYTVTGDLAEEVFGYADAVVVLGPPALREDVVRRLRVAAALVDLAPTPPAGGSDG